MFKFRSNKYLSTTLKYYDKTHKIQKHYYMIMFNLPHMYLTCAGWGRGRGAVIESRGRRGPQVGDLINDDNF